MISNSGLRPGDVLAREADLEKRLKVSRSILREAIGRLRGLGMLESRQCVGLIVSKPDPVGLFEQTLESSFLDALDVEQLIEVRYALELGAVELVARRATEKQLARLVDLGNEFTDRVLSTTRGCPILDVDFDFHRTILEASGNQMLARMHHVISAYFLRAPIELENWDFEATPKARIWEHRAIAQALQVRNAERARVLLSRHLAPLLALISGSRGDFK